MLLTKQKSWALVARGVVAMIFGAVALLSPGIALATMVVAFGTFAIVDGLVALVALGAKAMGREDMVGSPVRIVASTDTPWWLQLMIGIAGLTAGIMAFSYPGLTALTLLSFIGAYAIVVGVAQFVAAIQQRNVEGSGWLAVSGLVSMIFGALVFARPEAGALAVAGLIGAYALIAGGSLIGAGAIVGRMVHTRDRLTSTMLPEETRERVER